MVMSEATTQRPEEYQRRQEKLAGWKVGIVSYRLGERYYCTVDNVSPGARLARGEGATREEAERQALDKAQKMLSGTRTFPE
jgi:dsRNA-specific ribonuclease